jgi:hypothetical protein
MRLQNIILIILLLGLISCNSTDSVFSDETYQDTIKQDIGGLLVRDIQYTNDFHSWDYDIKYFYKDKRDSFFVVGTGNYHGQDLPKNEQLIQINKWIVLKTGDSGYGDKIIIGNLQNNIWTEYLINPKTIEKDIVWQKYNISSEPDNGDSYSKIEAIESTGKFSAIYRFAKKDRIFSFMTGEGRVDYIINIQSGGIEMIEVSEK